MSEKPTEPKSDTPIYYWFSKQDSDKRVGCKIKDKSGSEFTDVGYCIILDLETGKLSQCSLATRSPDDAPKKLLPDVQLAVVIGDLKNVHIALNIVGEISPLGQELCQKQGLPATSDSLKSLVANFYEPRASSGYAPEPLDSRNPPKPPKL
jgi:hypothetical protein